MADCIFCKIVAKQIPAKVVHEDADVIAFEDLNPQAPTHVLVIPRKHIATMNDLAAEDEALMGKLYRAGAAIARARGFAGSGWRAVMNANRDAGQTVFHLHLHVLGGKPMGLAAVPAGVTRLGPRVEVEVSRGRPARWPSGSRWIVATSP